MYLFILHTVEKGIVEVINCVRHARNLGIMQKLTLFGLNHKVNEQENIVG